MCTEKELFEDRPAELFPVQNNQVFGRVKQLKRFYLDRKELTGDRQAVISNEHRCHQNRGLRGYRHPNFSDEVG